MEAYVNPGQRIGLNSSNLQSLAYDIGSRVLDIFFLNPRGGNPSCYRYFEVPSDVVLHVLCASSQGTAFNELVKAKFEYEKIAN